MVNFRILKKIDGTEFRFVQALTKNWKKSFNFRDFSRTNVSPYDMVMTDLSNKSADMSMCSIWLLQKYYRIFDLSTFYDQQCSTFLVPKPLKLNEATSIYMTLDSTVWFLFLFFFLLSSVLLYTIAKMEEQLYDKTSVFTDLTRSFLETIGMAASHPVGRIPRDQTSVKILLTR